MIGRDRLFWLIWSCGVVVFPIAGLFVLPDAVPFPRVVDFGRGIVIWLTWAAGFGAMAFAMFRLRDVPLRSLLVAQLVAGLAFVVVRAMPSIDTYAYLGYGSQLLHGANPWVAGPIVPNDGASQAFLASWGASPPNCRYGPGFVLFEAALVRVFGEFSVTWLVLVQRCFSLMAAVAITALVRGPNARFWALNPFVLYYFVLEAHNDVFFLLALAVASRARTSFLRGVAIGIGGSVKIVALAALAWSNNRRIFPSLAGSLLMFAGLYSCVPLALNGDGLRSQLVNVGNSISSLALSATVSALGDRTSVSGVELGVALSAVVLALFIRWTGRDAATYATLLFVAILPVFWPWYLGWALFASVASSHRATMRFVAMLCVFSFLTDLPYLDGFVFNVQVTWLFLGIVAALLYLCRIIPQNITRPWGRQSILWYLRCAMRSSGRSHA